MHRQFLFEANVFVWDRDFRAMKAAGVNLVRTGIWTGWKKFMPAAGKVNEATLRALDAFLLTAHSYDISVIFTFFAFLPETWGGKNAYLDSQAVQAQAAVRLDIRAALSRGGRFNLGSNQRAFVLFAQTFVELPAEL